MSTASTQHLSPGQLAERWSFHPESVRRTLRSGKIPCLRIGKRIRVALADVEAFEASHRIYPAQNRGEATQ